MDSSIKISNIQLESNLKTFGKICRFPFYILHKTFQFIDTIFLVVYYKLFLNNNVNLLSLTYEDNTLVQLQFNKYEELNINDVDDILQTIIKKPQIVDSQKNNFEPIKIGDPLEFQDYDRLTPPKELNNLKVETPVNNINDENKYNTDETETETDEE